MLWMGIWVHTYAVLHVQVGVNIRKNGVWPSLYDVVVSWLRLLPTSILDVYKVFKHLEMLWMGKLYIPNTWGNTQYMTVKLMPGGV